MEDSSNSSFDTLCGTELLSVEEEPTESSHQRSTPLPFEQSISDATGISWPPFIFLSDFAPSNLLFADPEPIDRIFSHLYFQYKPHYPLLPYPFANVRSNYLCELLVQDYNGAGISSWDFGFDNRLFSLTWRQSGEPCVSRYRFTGDINQKKESIMAHLFTLMKCSEGQISKIYETAKDACQTEASVEFLESTKEFFTISNANNGPQYQITYVKDRWAPLASFMRDPVVRRFLNHLTVNSYLERAARRDAVKLLREVDLKYRDELGSALVNLQVLFDKDIPSTAATSEKAPSEAAHPDILPAVGEELGEDHVPLLTSNSSSKSKKKKKKNSAKRKPHRTDGLFAVNAPNSEVAFANSLDKEPSGSSFSRSPPDIPSSPIETATSDGYEMGNSSNMQHTDVSSTEELTTAAPHKDVAGLSMDCLRPDASGSGAAVVGMADMAELEIAAKVLSPMANTKQTLSTEEPKGLPIVSLEQISVVPPLSVIPGLSAKALMAETKHDTSSNKKDKAKRRDPSFTTGDVNKGASSSVLEHQAERACQNAVVGKQGSHTAVTSVDAKEASTSAIILGSDNSTSKDPQNWSDEMDIEETLRQFPNLKEYTDARDKDEKVDVRQVQTGIQDSDNGWTVVKSTPKKVKKATTEGSPRYGARNASPKGLCIGTNYRIPQKSAYLHNPPQTPSTVSALDNSTKIDSSKIQKAQPVASTLATGLTQKAPAPADVLPISGLITSEKRGTKAANRSSSHKFPIDQVACKSNVEVKLSANLKSDTLPSSTATLHETSNSTKVNLEASPKQSSNLVETPISEIKSPQTAQAASGTVQALDPLPEDLTSEVVASQTTTERVPGILVGVLMKAGVKASALSSLMVENSSAMLHENILAKLDENQGQANPISESALMISTAAEIGIDCENRIRSVSTDDTLNNQAMQTPTTPTVARDNPLSTEQAHAATENCATKKSDVAGKSLIEKLPLNEEVSTEQPAIDCGEYQGWMTKPTVITWDNKDGYEVLGDRCPPPLTLADHPELNKVLKPGFVFKCAYCQQETFEDMIKETAVVCPGCGPCSHVRYCQKSHLLADVLEHQKICGTKSGEFPILIHMLPDHYKSLYPYIKPIDGSMSPECFRQMAYSMIVERDGEIENPFLAFYNFKMSKKGKKRLAEYKNDTYQFQDCGNYYIFSSADAPRGTATLMTLNMIEGGPFFDRARNALFLHNDPKLMRFVYRKIKADVMLHPDKGFRAEVLLALESQFSREFPHFDISKAGYIGVGRLTYDVDAEWKVIENIVQKYENTHPILKTWINPPKKLDKSAMQSWGIGWTGQPAEEWMRFLNMKYHEQVHYYLRHGMTREEHDLEVLKNRVELADLLEKRRVREEATELEKRKVIEEEAEEHAELDDQMHEDRMKLVKRHLADPAVQEIYRNEDAAKEEREAIARAQYHQ